MEILLGYLMQTEAKLGSYLCYRASHSTGSAPLHISVAWHSASLGSGAAKWVLIQEAFSVPA